MPFGRGAVAKGPKHVDQLSREFEDTQTAFYDAIAVHEAEAAERHDHVNARLAALEDEAKKLDDLRNRIASQ
jgi:hypothetical protein